MYCPCAGWSWGHSSDRQSCPPEFHSLVGDTDVSPGSGVPELSGLGWRGSGDHQSPEWVPEPAAGVVENFLD